MKYVFLFLYIVLLLPNIGYGQTLADQFKKAKSGDFVVFQQNHHITLFHVSAAEDGIVSIEEVTSSDKDINPQTISWKDWLENGAPNHSSWTLTQLDLNNGKILSTLSFSNVDHEWVQHQPLFVFLPTLLQLPLEVVPPEERKQIGAAPMPGEIDRRKPWIPKAIVNGKELPPPVPFIVYRVRWPTDTSELAGKAIYLYLCQAPQALNYFPYWIEIAGKIGKVKLRVIDSGTGLIPSPLNSSPVMNKENREEK